MSERECAMVMLPQPAPAAPILNEVRRRLVAMGVQPSPEPFVIFHWTDDARREDEAAATEEAAAALILSWPWLGGMEYFLDDYGLSVFLYGTESCHVDMVTVSVSSRRYAESEQLRGAFELLVRDLHRALAAKRTISGWGLPRHGSWWLEELGRVRRDIFEDRYAIDLR